MTHTNTLTHNTNFTETEKARRRETERKREMKMHLDVMTCERILLVSFSGLSWFSLVTAVFTFRQISYNSVLL